MKISCLSDMHGQLPTYVPDCDLLLIAGDVCPATNHDPARQRFWLDTIFTRWLTHLTNVKQIVGIAGNHDFAFQLNARLPSFLGGGIMSQLPDVVKFEGWKYLLDEATTIGGFKIYGLPWTPMYGYWAFNAGGKVRRKLIHQIPEDTDILVSHGPPKGVMDAVEGTKEYLGDQRLGYYIKEKLPRLKLHVFGHIHSAHGVQYDAVSKLTSVNASILDEDYEVAYPIVEVEL